jgi:signal transduction histidine kinase
VVLNVVGNALKFTQPGGEVNVVARPLAGGVEISVADNGPGIEPGNLERLFDPLWQPHGGERTDGLGLGLPLVKRLVEAHGGQVRVASEGLGRGTEVVLVLPCEGGLDANVAV